MSKTDELFRPKLNAYTKSPFPLAFTGSFTIQTVEVPSSASSGESLRTSLSQTEKNQRPEVCFTLQQRLEVCLTVYPWECFKRLNSLYSPGLK